MKPLIIVSFLLAIGSSAFSMKKGPGLNHNCIRVISMTHEMFYFKSDKEISGANVEVYEHKTGKKVISQVINKKRTIIDFFDLEPGDYIILVTKGEFKRKYVYRKNYITV